MKNKRIPVYVWVLAALFICICILMIAFGAFLLTRPSPTPTTVDTATPVPGQIPTNIPQPTRLPPTLEPTTEIPAPLPANSSFTINGVDLQVYSVVYTLINGGEYGAFYPTDPDEFYLLLSLSSQTKDLSFFFHNFVDTLYLYDPSDGSTIYPDYYQWSTEESEASFGYIQISFPITSAPSQAILHINDDLEINLSATLPQDVSYTNPWLDVTQLITIDGYNILFDSVTIYDSYTSYDGTPIEKTNPDDKILVIKMISETGDMSIADKWDNFMIIDNLNIDNQYYHYERSWSENTSGEGYVYFVFVIPNGTSEYTLYLPFETLIDLAPITQFGY